MCFLKIQIPSILGQGRASKRDGLQRTSKAARPFVPPEMAAGHHPRQSAAGLDQGLLHTPTTTYILIR